MILTFMCAAGACEFCAGEKSGELTCEHSCHTPDPDVHQGGTA